MKLVMFDLDGTLLSNMYDISEGNRKAFRKLYRQGYRLGIATGRRVSNVEEILGNDIQYFDVIIGENGFQTKDLKLNESTYTRKLSASEIREIIDTFNDKTLDINFCHFDQSGTYFFRHSTFSNSSEYDLNRKVIYTNGKYFSDLPKMCMPVGASLAEIYREKVENLKSDSYHGMMTGYGFFEFMSKETSKWLALEKYLIKNHYAIDDTIAFGDSGNDMEILSHVGFAVAMQNADRKVKEICHDMTTYPYHEDGVGKYIEEKMLSNE